MKKYQLYCESFQIYKGNMWFISGNFLCCRNLETGKVKLETYIVPQYGIGERYLLSSITDQYNGRLICIPEMSDRILDYDIESRVRSEIIFPEIECDDTIKYRSSCIIDKKVYIMPQSAHQIIVYDLETKQMDLCSDWFEILQREDKSITYKRNLFSLSRKVNKKIYFCTMYSNVLCCFDTQNGGFEGVHIGPSEYCYQLLYHLNGVFYLVDNIHRKIVRWSEAEGIIGKAEGIGLEIDRQKTHISDVEPYILFDAINIGEKIIFPACLGDKSYEFDTVTGQVRECDLIANVRGCCYVGVSNDDEIIMASVTENKLYAIDSQQKCRETELYLIDNPGNVGRVCCFSIPFLEKRKDEAIWYENQEVTLDGFLKYII